MSPQAAQTADACQTAASESIRSNLAPSEGLPGIAALVGAPKTGKTRLVIRLVANLEDAALLSATAERAEIERWAAEEGLADDQLLELTDLNRTTEFDVIVIDDLYRVIDECVRKASAHDTPTVQEITPETLFDNVATLADLRSLLAREHGLCVVTTPYRWNFLTSPDAPQEYRRGVEPILDRTDIDFTYLEYDCDDAAAHWERVTEEGSTNGEPTFPHFELDISQDRTAIATDPYTYSSAVPYALLQTDRRVVGDITPVLEELVEGEAYTLIGSGATALSGFVASGVGGVLAATGLTIGLAVPAVIGLRQLFNHLRGESTEYQEIQDTFGELLELSSPEMELVEQHIGVAPLTLEQARELWLQGPDRFRELEAILAQHSERLDTLAAETQLTGDEIDAYVAAIADTVDIGDFTFADIVNFYGENVSKAVESPEKLREHFQKPQDFLPETALATEDNWQVVHAQNVGNATNSAVPDQVTRIVETIETEEPEVVLIGGQRGIGKTTVAYEVAQRVVDSGAFVGVPNPRFDVEFVLDRREEHRSVLILDDFTTQEIGIIKDVLGWIRNDYCDTVVLIYESLEFTRLDQGVRRHLSDDPQLLDWWRTGTTERRFVIDGLTRPQMHQLISANFGTLDPIGERARTEVYNRIWSLSRTAERANPLLVSIAANAAKQNEDLWAIKTAEILLWERVAPDFEADPGTGEFTAQTKALGYIAAAGSISQSTLQELLGVDNFEMVRTGIDAYVTESRQGLTIEPSYLSQLIFQNHCISRFGAQGYDILGGFCELPKLLYRMGEQLGIQYRLTDPGECDEAKIITGVIFVLERLAEQSPERYCSLLADLAYDEVPVPYDAIDENAIEAGRSEWNVDFVTAGRHLIPVRITADQVLMNTIGRIAAAHLPTDERAAQEVFKVFVEATDSYGEAMVFVSRTYGIVVSTLAEDKSTAEVEELITDIEGLVRTPALQTGTTPASMGLFFGTVLSSLIAKAERHDEDWFTRQYELETSLLSIRERINSAFNPNIQSPDGNDLFDFVCSRARQTAIMETGEKLLLLFYPFTILRSFRLLPEADFLWLDRAEQNLKNDVLFAAMLHRRLQHTTGFLPNQEQVLDNTRQIGNESFLVDVYVAFVETATDVDAAVDLDQWFTEIMARADVACRWKGRDYLMLAQDLPDTDLNDSLRTHLYERVIVKLSQSLQPGRLHDLLNRAVEYARVGQGARTLFVERLVKRFVSDAYRSEVGIDDDVEFTAPFAWFRWVLAQPEIFEELWSVAGADRHRDTVVMRLADAVSYLAMMKSLEAADTDVEAGLQLLEERLRTHTIDDAVVATIQAQMTTVLRGRDHGLDLWETRYETLLASPDENHG